MNSNDVMSSITDSKGASQIQSYTWSQLVSHVVREPTGIHLVCGDTGIGVPFVAEALRNAAAGAGLRTAHQEFPLLNRPNWQRAIRLSRSGHLVVLRLYAKSLTDLWRRLEALKVTPNDLELVRSAVIARKIDIRIARPDCWDAAAPVFSEVALFDRQPTALGYSGSKACFLLSAV